MEIRVAVRRGTGIRQIARELGCSRNTVKQYLRDAQAVRYGPRAPHPTKRDPFKQYLRDRARRRRRIRFQPGAKIQKAWLDREVVQSGYC